MRIVKLNSVEPRFPCARSSRCEYRRQLARQFSDVLQMRVRDSFAIPKIQRFTFAFIENSRDKLVTGARQKRS